MLTTVIFAWFTLSALSVGYMWDFAAAHERDNDAVVRAHLALDAYDWRDALVMGVDGEPEEQVEPVEDNVIRVSFRRL